MKPWELNLHTTLEAGPSVRSSVCTGYRNACLSSQKAHTSMFSMTPNWKSPRCPAFRWKPAQRNTKQHEAGRTIPTQCDDSQKRCKGGKPDSKGDLVHDSIYTQLRSLQNSSVGTAVRLVAAFWEKRRELGWQQIQGGVLWGAGNIPVFD